MAKKTVRKFAHRSLRTRFSTKAPGMNVRARAFEHDIYIRDNLGREVDIQEEDLDNLIIALQDVKIKKQRVEAA